MSSLINLSWDTDNAIFGSLEIGYFMRMKNRGERAIIAKGNIWQGHTGR